MNLVVNLSSRDLSEKDTAVLNKGLSFIPTPTANPFQTKIELFKFFRNMKLKYFFSKDKIHLPPTDQIDSNSAISQPFKTKSKFVPPIICPSIETFCKLVERDVNVVFQTQNAGTKHYSNLDTQERVCLKKLSKESDIIFKGADKGGGLICMDRVNYETEIAKQLADTVAYSKLPSDPTTKFKREIDTFLNAALAAGHITSSEKKFLINEHPTIPVIYTLPKVHKQFTKIPPGRPIVSSNNSLTEPLSKYIDHHIRSLVTDLPSYIRDTGDLINQLSQLNVTDNNIILATMDVSSLYTNIPHQSGLMALQHFLDKRENESPPTQFILELTDIVLSRNYFLFGQDFYLQKMGVAMGAAFAPDFANLFLGMLEERYIYANNIFSNNILFYKRYIDDCLLVWQGSEQLLNSFLLYMNCLHNTIKFNMECDPHKVSFLDTWVIFENNSIHTSLYVKPTDKNSILHASSFHPSSLKQGLPYSQFLRVRRICSDDNDFQTESEKMYTQFLDRGYGRKTLDQALTKVNQTHMGTLTSKKKKEHSLICCTTYTPLSNQITQIIKKHWNVLNTDPVCSSLFKELPLFTHSRSRNIRDILVHADTFDHSKAPKDRLDAAVGFFPCRNCTSCTTTGSKKTSKFMCHVSGKEYNINKFITCSSSSVIYLLSCPCGLQYIGKTNRQLRVRINEHRSAISRNDPKSPIARHFSTAPHTTAQLQFIGIDRVTPSRRNRAVESKLLQCEAKWIFYMQTLSPKGLNEDLDLTCFL